MHCVVDLSTATCTLPFEATWSCCTGNIITGSLQGVLRVYQPHGQGFSIEDLLLEVQLSAPILQLELGTFTS